MNRDEVDELIRRCERCRAEACDCPSVVHDMDVKLDVLHTIRDSVPLPKPREP